MLLERRRLPRSTSRASGKPRLAGDFGGLRIARPSNLVRSLGRNFSARSLIPLTDDWRSKSVGDMTREISSVHPWRRFFQEGACVEENGGRGDAHMGSQPGIDINGRL